MEKKERPPTTQKAAMDAAEAVLRRAVGSTLAAARANAGYSQAEAALSLGTDETALSRLERGLAGGFILVAACYRLYHLTWQAGSQNVKAAEIERMARFGVRTVPLRVKGTPPKRPPRPKKPPLAT